MRIKVLSRMACLGVLGWLLLVFACGSAMAHSTAGRVKVPLNKESLLIDDVAYFMEFYVNRHLYDDQTNDTKNRYVIESFSGLTQQQNEALVQFEVLDKKNHTFFDETLSIERNNKGVWQYRPQGDNPPFEVFTYVSKSAYNWQKQRPILLLVTAMGVCGWLGQLLLRRLRRPKGVPAS